VRTYLYWSEQRIRRFADDNGVRLDGGMSVSVRTPSFGVLPEIGGSLGPTAASRQKIADKIERSIGQLAVEDFVTPPPVRFAKGVGAMVFSEFYSNGPTGAAMACTTTLASDGTRVAVCLFGSVGNFAGMLTEVERRETGWSSSNAPTVLRFIENGGLPDKKDPPWLTEVHTPEWYADEAFKIAFRQGEKSGTDRVLDHPWRRGFSYGHIDDAAEWLADIFVDVLIDADRLRRFDRVLVGAPLWIRTPTPSSLRIYDPGTIALLERSLKRSDDDLLSRTSAAGTHPPARGGWRG
jgi:hypothetical protein